LTYHAVEQATVIIGIFSYDLDAGGMLFSPPKKDANQPPVVVLPKYDMVFSNHAAPHAGGAAMGTTHNGDWTGFRPL
jgi:hypothetical protein